jgi:hypothetical protein
MGDRTLPIGTRFAMLQYLVAIPLRESQGWSWENERLKQSWER